jgi:hypothetical protein
MGSGTILMEPHDQYLDVVSKGAADETDSRKLVLPFEGEHRLQ